MAPATKINQLKSAYAYCQCIAKAHYENFPVASIFIPKELRQAVVAIYAFARLADDYADDPKLDPTEKLCRLNILTEELISIQTKTAINHNNKILNENLRLALTDTINSHALPMQLLLDLLTAFKQDVTKHRYADFNEVLTYCSYSANPIGRLLLYLAKQDTPENLAYSDHICTSLQLINFMQDLAADLTQLDRCYIPEHDLNKYNISITALKAKQSSPNIDALICYQLDRIYTIYNKGLALRTQLSGLFGFEIRLIIAGAKQMLIALYARKNYYQRPTLTLANKLQMFMLALFPNGGPTND